jgi:pimeloyl-ACP methyl ester carboxylesterase
LIAGILGAAMPDEVACESLFIAAPDGLKLHLRAYGRSLAPRLPVLCLAGLSRTAQDFDALARALAGEAAAPRLVLALDYRGRGLSDYDPNADNYSVAVEVGDVIAVLAATEAAPAVVIGTSRGGLVAMALAAAQPGAVAGVVLNDIGPVIEPKGLLRIKGYVGKLPEPKTFAEGADILRRLAAGQFPKLEDAGWLALAKRSWREHEGGLVPTYDPALDKTLAAVTPEGQLPDMWPQFDALRHFPLLTIRGANSDILSVATVAAMAARHPGMEVLEVPDQGHAPLLDDDATIGRIASFLAACDARQGYGSFGWQRKKLP